MHFCFFLFFCVFWNHHLCLRGCVSKLGAPQSIMISYENQPLNRSFRTYYWKSLILTCNFHSCWEAKLNRTQNGDLCSVGSIVGKWRPQQRDVGIWQSRSWLASTFVGVNIVGWSRKFPGKIPWLELVTGRALPSSLQNVWLVIRTNLQLLTISGKGGVNWSWPT